MSDVLESHKLAGSAAASRISAKPRPRLMLAVMLLSVFITVSNVFIVSVSTPAIQKALHTSFAGVQFVVSGYTLAYGVSLIIGGRLGDRYGRKRLLLLGVAGFTAGSFLSGIAPSIGLLLAARIIQGFSAALLTPQILSLIQVHYPPEKRGPVLGLYGASIGLSAATGQIIGGLLISWNPGGLDWRTVFFFTVPVGILLMALLPFISESREPAGSKLDWTGAFLVALGLFMLAYPLVQGPKEGWPAYLIILLILALPVLIVFGLFEKSLKRRGRVPLMNVSLFGQKMFTTGMGVVFLQYLLYGSFFFVSSFLLQVGFGFSPLKAGAIVLPMGLGIFIASLVSAKVAAKIGPRVLLLGTVLAAVGFLALVLSVHLAGIGFAGYEWIPALAVLGIGLGFIASPITNIVLAKVRSDDIGSASGILTTGMQVGLTIGIALIGIVWQNALGNPAPALTAAHMQTYADAFMLCLYLLVGLTAIILVLSLLLSRKVRTSSER